MQRVRSLPLRYEATMLMTFGISSGFLDSMAGLDALLVLVRSGEGESSRWSNEQRNEMKREKRGVVSKCKCQTKFVATVSPAKPSSTYVLPGAQEKRCRGVKERLLQSLAAMYYGSIEKTCSCSRHSSSRDGLSPSHDLSLYVFSRVHSMSNT